MNAQKGNQHSHLCISFYITMKGAFYLKEHASTTEICRSIFKNGDIQTTKRDYTKAWISLINELERRKGVTAGSEK